MQILIECGFCQEAEVLRLLTDYVQGQTRRVATLATNPQIESSSNTLSDGQKMLKSIIMAANSQSPSKVIFFMCINK